MARDTRPQGLGKALLGTRTGSRQAERVRTVSVNNDRRKHPDSYAWTTRESTEPGQLRHDSRRQKEIVVELS